MKNGVIFLLGYSWKKNKAYIIYSVLLQILTAIVPLADIVIPKFIIDELMGKSRMPYLIFWIGLLIFITLVGTFLISFLSGRCFVAKNKIFSSFQGDLSERLSRCDFERLEDSHFLDTKAKAEKFLYANGQGFGVVMDNTFKIFGKILTFLGIITIVSTLSAWVVLLFVLLILLNSWYESRVRKEYVKWDMDKAPIERKTSYLINLISDFAFGKEIRIFGMKDWLSDKIRFHLNESGEFYAKQIKTLCKSEYISGFMNFLLKGITYGYLVFQVAYRSLGIGNFTMYITTLMSFSSAMNDVMKSILDIRQFGGYYEALKEYMEIPQKMREGKGLSLPEGEFEIRFENVSFRYAGQSTDALKNINITLAPGEKLSVVGENGAGKTTFVKLLCRLYNPTEGRILLNGIDIRDIDYDQYMSSIGAVFQDYKLLSFTLKENIAFSSSEQEKAEDIYGLLCHSGLQEKMEKLPDGVETYVYKNFSEKGFEPSGGEGQKIALARAIYKNAPVMILDEPTSALDPRAEYEIYQRFSELVSGKTAVFISHRMSSARFCDHIAVFKDGEIAEYGTHEKLMERNGIYYELFQMQAQYYNL